MINNRTTLEITLKKEKKKLKKEKGNRLQYQRQYAYYAFIFKNDNAMNRKKGNRLQDQRQYAYYSFIFNIPFFPVYSIIILP